MLSNPNNECNHNVIVGLALTVCLVLIPHTQNSIKIKMNERLIYDDKISEEKGVSQGTSDL